MSDIEGIYGERQKAYNEGFNDCYNANIHINYELQDMYERGKADMLKVLEDIKAEIGMYEADCILQGGSDECEICNNNVFGSIYRIIDKHMRGTENE